MAGETRLAVAEGKCDRCARHVEVKLNIGGKAYYVCGGCGWRGEFTNVKFSGAWVSQLTGTPEPAAGPATAAQAAQTSPGAGVGKGEAEKTPPKPAKRASPFDFLAGSTK